MKFLFSSHSSIIENLYTPKDSLSISIDVAYRTEQSQEWSLLQIHSISTENGAFFVFIFYELL